MNSKPSHKTYGFTIIELLIAIFIISLVILSVVTMIRASSGHINKIRQETIAINLAREGMEAMYTRRNTNRLQHPSEKDKYWLCTNNETPCYWFNNMDGEIFFPRYDDNGEVYFVSDGGNTAGDLTNGGSYLMGDNEFIGQKPSGGNYYRAIMPYGLYQKDVNIEGGALITTCIESTSEYSKLDFDGNNQGNFPCGDETPKEFLFCSKVQYTGVGVGKGNVELCGSITNYQE